MKHWEKRANGWVFLSHSSDDYEEVKVVRNYLEENGFSALMFYLKCFEDKSKISMAQKLIKWEIESRNIFVLCKSKSADSSSWVQLEVDYVKTFPEKIFREIYMDRLKYEKCTELSQLDNLMNQSTLFFTYSRSPKDKKFVEKVSESLASLGFKIFSDYKSIRAGEKIAGTINDAIEEVSKSGIVLMFLSKNCLKSNWFWLEKGIALDSDSMIIPIIIDDVNIAKFPAFRDQKYLDMSEGDFQENIKKLLQRIKSLNKNQ